MSEPDITRPSSRAGDGADRAWGWVAHLGAGGTTPWSRWHDPAPPSGRVLPGAQQLELLRRLNLAGAPTPALAERVLTASSLGRGLPDLELVGGAAPRRFGTAPVDPADLSERELLRVATTLLAEDVAALEPEPPREGFPRPWRVRHHLVGDPLRTQDVRAALLRAGRGPGGPRPQAFVLAGPVDHLLADTWTRRCFEQGVESWPAFVQTWHKHDRLPPRVDLVDVVERMAGRHGRHAVRVVVDQSQLPSLLGVRRLPAQRRPSAESAELARRIASGLGLLVPPGRREELMRWALWPRMPRTASAPVSVPEAHLDWLDGVARRMSDRIRAGGYPVVGDLEELAPATGGQDRPARLADRVFDLATQMLLDERWRA